MQARLPPQVARYLAEHHVVTLATQGADGLWAVAVFYASDGVSLIFLSAPNTRHCRNLAQVARCAATIQEDYRDWSQIKGIQLEWLVIELQGDEEKNRTAFVWQEVPLRRRGSRGPARHCQGAGQGALVQASARAFSFHR